MVLRRNYPCWHLAFGLLASRMVGGSISVVEVTLFVVLCFGIPSKLILKGKVLKMKSKLDLYSTIHP